MVKIAFHSPQLDTRGTCVALYDYAHYNELILGNKRIVVVDGRNRSLEKAVTKFTKRFPVFYHSGRDRLHSILIRESVDVLYAIKSGEWDEIVFEDIKTVVHCVFELSEPHGAVYAAVSKTLASKYIFLPAGKHPPFVPHMISLKPGDPSENLRRTLGIPENASVFGRYGGVDTFDIPFVHDAIRWLVTKHKNLWFIFMGAPHFYLHSRVIYLPQRVESARKNRFIQTCDAFLECGTMGHSFGLAIGEFSVNNKPVIAYRGPMLNTAHVDILGSKALYFTTREEFEDIILHFDRSAMDEDLNCYRDYRPEKVMEIFSRVFLEEKG